MAKTNVSCLTWDVGTTGGGLHRKSNHIFVSKAYPRPLGQKRIFRQFIHMSQTVEPLAPPLCVDCI